MNLRLAACVLAFGLLASACTTDGPPVQRQNSKHAAAEANLQLGVAYMQQGNFVVAKDKLERAAKQKPDDPKIHMALGMLNERIANPKQADSHYATAVRLAPDDPEVQNNYAVYLCQSGRTDEGVKRFEQAAKNPMYRTPEAAYGNAGVCQRAAKRYEDASRNFARALQIRPNYMEAAFQLADMRLEQGEFQQAINIVDRYTETLRPTPDMLYLGVRIARASGDSAAEARYSRRLRTDFPNSEQTRSLQSSARNPG